MKVFQSTLAFSLTLVVSFSAFCKATENEIAQLGNTLTPLGAEKAGNKDGSIPAWTGGITQVPQNYTLGDHHPDPFANERPLFVITAQNYNQYSQYLTQGQMALFKAYPDTFTMPIYPTHRSASLPQYVYDAIKKHAANAQLVDGGEGIANAAIGIPFPFPKNGLEAIWNHVTHYRGTGVERWGGQAALLPDGDYTLIKFDEAALFQFGEPDMTPEKLQESNIVSMLRQQVTSPARLKGTALLVHETLNQQQQPRQAWVYNTGQRRVRKAPNVAFDEPGTASDNLRTTDDYDMFNGSPGRYNWTLLGKKEIYIPYNSYKLHAKGLSYDDVLKPGHVNPEYTRYEKHRVWVVQADLKENMRHIYKKRVFYLDEDSWQISVADIYDSRDQLYRVNMSYAINYYEVPLTWSTLDVYHDLNSRRYLAAGLDNNEKMYDFTADLNERDFTPQALRRRGIR